MAFISKSNFYKLMIQSRKPEAEALADWATEVVFPSIEKFGMYLTLEKAKEELELKRKLAVQILKSEGSIYPRINSIWIPKEGQEVHGEMFVLYDTIKTAKDYALFRIDELEKFIKFVGEKEAKIMKR